MKGVSSRAIIALAVLASLGACTQPYQEGETTTEQFLTNALDQYGVVRRVSPQPSAPAPKPLDATEGATGV